MESDEQSALDRVAAAVTARRAELRLSQAALASAADVDPKTVRSLENGERWPQLAKRAAIASALGWTSSSLDRIRKGYSIEPLPAIPTASAAPQQRPKRYGAWSLDTGILAELSSAADTVHAKADETENYDSESDIEDVLSSTEELVESAKRLVELAQAVAEVGVGGRVHLQILKTGPVQFDEPSALTRPKQGTRPDYELAARPGETEDEIREKLGIEYE
ncbi:helix-turn-helix domain-containing protein [Rhodococcus sp. NPDC079359]|uniref:helix-turn-helix domain-containing protein n=1 Tax=Rhodococcus sp. NPDC079359 TaxID=3154961 RepID=UPI003450BE0E